MVGDRDRPQPPARSRPPRSRRAATCGSGMEDNVVFARGMPVEHNSQLVERAAHLAEVMQRPAMSTADARTMLGVKDRG